MSIEIPLLGGSVTVIDEADLGLISAHRWRYVHRARHLTPYAETSVIVGHRRNVTLSMHRLLLGQPATAVDHINGNGLDNRRANLRLATPGQNARNRPSQRGHSSAFKGVTWNRVGSTWQVSIMANGSKRYLGGFADEVEAARCYDAAARELHGAFARLNFPEASEQSALSAGAR